jgi:hypothetical protein
MSKDGKQHNKVEKKTRQNGTKTATMNKSVKRSFKKYRGQGK